MNEPIQGIYAAVITPFDDQGRIATDDLITHINQLARRGCHGMLLAGTTGEGPSLSAAERIELFKVGAAVDESLRLLAGTGGASLEDVVTLTRAAFDHGCAAAVIIPPFFYPAPSLPGLFQFYSEVIRRSVPEDGAVLLYHNPGVAGVGISPELIKRLRDKFPRQVAGIKDSSRDWEHTQMLIEAFPDFQVLVGDDTLLARTLEAGGAGAITGIANLFPDLLRDVFNRHRKGSDLQASQERLNQACTQLAGLPRIPAIKTLLMAGHVIEANHVRPPLIQMAQDEFNELSSRFHLDIEMPQSIDLGDLYF